MLAYRLANGLQENPPEPDEGPNEVRGAKAYVHDAIARSFFVGENCGVLGFAPRS